MTFPRGSAMLARELNPPHHGRGRRSPQGTGPPSEVIGRQPVPRTRSAERGTACSVAQQHSAAVVSDSRNDLERGPRPRGEELVVGTVVRVAGETVLALEVARTARVQV